MTSARLTKMKSQLAAMSRLADIAKPYAKLNPQITMGDVLTAEVAKVAAAPRHSLLPWESGTVMIRLKRGSQMETAAKILGPLAVNRDNKNNRLFCLTHRPTGFCLLSSHKERVLMDAAERVVHLDWGFSRPEDIPPTTQSSAWVVLAAAHLGVLSTQAREVRL